MNNNFDVLSQYLKTILTNDKNTYLLIADGLESYTLGDFKKNCEPEVLSRIVNIGISEQNALSLAAGLALGGKIVYVVMFTPFMSMRAAEQIKLDICYSNANVKIIGTNAGFYGTSLGGYSHCSLEDIALFNALPNIKIYSPAPNKNEMETVLSISHKIKGPVYVRLNAAGSPYKMEDYKVKANKLSQVVKGKDAAIIATGYSVEVAAYYASRLANKPSVYSVNCLKPFDEEGLLKIADKYKTIFTLEEHAAGGLASIVSMIIAKTGKKVKYVPIYSDTDNYNCVVESRNAIYKHFLLDFESFAKLYIDTIMRKDGIIFKRRGYITSKKEVKTDYKLLNIPVLSKVARTKIKKGRLKNKYYLFNIRII